MFRPITHITPIVAVLSLAAAAPAHAAGPDHFTISVSPRPVKAGAPLTIKAYAKDRAGTTLAGYSAPATFSDTGGPLGDAKFANGVASLALKLPDPIHRDVVQVAADGTTSSSTPFDVLGPVTAFEVRVPATGAYDAPLTTTVIARDAAGSVVSDYAGAYSWSDDRDVISPATPGPFVRGVSQTTITRIAPVRGDVLHVVGADGKGDSHSFSRIGPVDHIDVSAPRSVPRTDGLNVVASARDAAGNLVKSFNGPATWSDTSDELSPSVPNAFANGVSSTTAHVAVAYRGDVITVAGAGSSGRSRPLNVIGYPFSLRVSGTPTQAKVGTPFTLTVTALDAAGNVATGFDGDFDDSNPTIWSYDFESGAVAPFEHGVSHTSVTLTKPSRSDILTVFASFPLYANSDTFATIGPADHYEATWRPTATADGCEGSLILRALDATGNLVRDYDGTPPEIDASPAAFSLSSYGAEPFANGTSVTPLQVTGSEAGDQLVIQGLGADVSVPAC